MPYDSIGGNIPERWDETVLTERWADRKRRAADRKIVAAVWDIARLVCIERGVSLVDLIGRNQHRPIALARQEFMARAYAETGASLPQIGSVVGRDHSTVHHGVRAHRGRTAS